MSGAYPLSVIRGEIKRFASEVGFDLAGVAGVAETPENRFFPRWIAEGYAGEMSYLEKRNEAGELKRASLANVAPWARSVVVCALNYNSDQPYSTHAGTTSQGWISRYAWPRGDYHDVVLERLRALEARLPKTCARAGNSGAAHLVLRGHRSGDRAHLRQVCRYWLDRQEHLHPERAVGLVAFSRRDAHVAGTGARLPCSGPLRFLHALSRCLPDERLSCALSTGRHQVHFVSHHREARLDTGRVARGNRTPGVRLRHLPGCLPVEPRRRR